MKNVSMTLRIDDEVKEAWKELAAKEGRSLAGYLERVVLTMRDRELLMDVSALDVIADRLVVISNRLEEMVLQSSKKIVKRKSSEVDRKLTAYDMEFDDFLSEPYWRKWIDHLHKSDVHLNHYMAKGQYERFRELDDTGINCESLVIELIKRTAKSIYIPNEWKRDLEKD